MNDTRRSILKNALTCTLGLMIFAAGVYLTIQADIGAAPWDVFTLGIHQKTGLLYGTVSIGIAVVCILTDHFILHEKIGIGTLLDAVTVGKTVDLLNLLDPVPVMTGPLLPRLLVFLTGFALMGFGQYYYMRSALSCGPKDTLFVGLSRHIPNMKASMMNTIILVVVLVLGLLLKGPFGIGSVIAPFASGFFQQLFFNIMHFDPKEVRHQSLSESWAVLTGRLPDAAARSAADHTKGV